MSNTQDNRPPSADDSDAEPPPPTDDDGGSGSNLQIDIAIDSVATGFDASRCRQAARAAAVVRGFHRGEIGIRITDDKTIRRLNAQHLGHDYATDVISFGYECCAPQVNGELIVSLETAQQQAHNVRWPVEHELLLYVVHGVLHITGMDDYMPHDRAAMRQYEQKVMLQLGIDEVVRCGADRTESDAVGPEELA